MTDKELKECIDDSEIYQSTVDSLVDELHDLISVGNISDAKIIADQIRELRPVGQQLSGIEQLPSKQSVDGSSPSYLVVTERL